MAKLHDKVILVTGAAQGIGWGCTRVCLAHGARVIALDKAAEETTRSALEKYGEVFAVSCDVTNHEMLAQEFVRAVAHFGKLDGVVNNAGWHPPAMDIERTSVADFEQLLRLNLTSTFLMCKLAVPHLKASKGSIVNMASGAGLVGQGEAPAYVATKSGQIGLTKALALDLAPFGVRVNSICPAGVMTPLMNEWANSQYDPAAALQKVDAWHAIGRMATVEEIGEVCAFLLSNEASFITGQALAADGGALLGYKR